MKKINWNYLKNVLFFALIGMFFFQLYLTNAYDKELQKMIKLNDKIAKFCGFTITHEED